MPNQKLDALLHHGQFEHPSPLFAQDQPFQSRHRALLIATSFPVCVLILFLLCTQFNLLHFNKLHTSIFTSNPSVPFRTSDKYLPVNANQLSHTKANFIHQTKDLTLMFYMVNFSDTWATDLYDSNSKLRHAPVDSKFLTAYVNITATTKTPSLPTLLLVSYTKDAIIPIKELEYKFYKWQDYSSFIDQTKDDLNDFSKSRTVTFSCGTLVSNTALHNQNLALILIDNSTYKKTISPDKHQISYYSKSTAHSIPEEFKVVKFFTADDIN